MLQSCNKVLAGSDASPLSQHIISFILNIMDVCVWFFCLDQYFCSWGKCGRSLIHFANVLWLFVLVCSLVINAKLMFHTCWSFLKRVKNAVEHNQIFSTHTSIMCNETIFVCCCCTGRMAQRAKTQCKTIFTFCFLFFIIDTCRLNKITLWTFFFAHICLGTPVHWRCCTALSLLHNVIHRTLLRYAGF